MDNSEGAYATNDKDVLEERILKLITAADYAKVDSNKDLRRIKDNALSYEIAAEELFTDIHEACKKAKRRIQRADTVKEQKNQALENAKQFEALTRAQFSDWQKHYEAFTQDQYQAVQQAKNATLQAEHEYNQACEAADRCREVAMIKKRLGMLAIGMVLDEQKKHTGYAWEDICEALNAQEEAMGGEASAA